MQSKVRPVAIYLPQFHPIPENDAWWGTGFTEWTNVTKAKPRFKAHYQPHLPADFGFYDLRVPEVMIAQAKLAQAHGIHGFCFYHYWFNGKRLLHRPLDQMITSQQPDFPFMLCWANENWTRRWDGKEHEVLMGQRYSKEDHITHIQFLCDNFFSDRRYIRIDDKPVFAIYRTELIDDIGITAGIWRHEARKRGFKDLYLISVESFRSGNGPEDIGFDSGMDFQPNWNKLPPKEKPSLLERVLHRSGLVKAPYFIDKIIDYRKVAAIALAQEAPPYKFYDCVSPMWDNSARRETGATILINSTPESYGSWLYQAIRKFKPYSREENLLFINAWNEWAEGNHLEPCLKWGRSYLETTRDSISKANSAA